MRLRRRLKIMKAAIGFRLRSIPIQLINIVGFAAIIVLLMR